MCQGPRRSLADRLDQAGFPNPEDRDPTKGSQSAPQEDGKTPEAAGEWDTEAAVASFRAAHFGTLNATRIVDRDYSSSILEDVPVSNEQEIYVPLQESYFGVARNALAAISPGASLTMSMSTITFHSAPSTCFASPVRFLKKCPCFHPELPKCDCSLQVCL